MGTITLSLSHELPNPVANIGAKMRGSLDSNGRTVAKV
jgi:hypothetical protein